MERACASAHAQAPSESGGMGTMGMDHGGRELWTGLGMLFAVGMGNHQVCTSLTPTLPHSAHEIAVSRLCTYRTAYT